MAAPRMIPLQDDRYAVTIEPEGERVLMAIAPTFEVRMTVREALDLMGALGEATHLAHVETCDRMGYATWLRR